MPPLPFPRFPAPRAARAAGRPSAALLLAFALGWGGGCATVPDTRILEHDYSTVSAEFRNAWGPVSERTKAAILAELKRGTGDLDILDRQIAIEQAVVGTPLSLGNRATLLQDGPETYRAMFAAIRTAQRTINAEFYIVEEDEIGRQFADLLLERRAAGVQVNLIYDSLGSLKTPKSYFERLRAGGVQIVEFNPVNPLAAKKRWSLNHRDHRKQVIVDGRTVILGGLNIDDVYAESSDQVARSGGGSSSGGSGRSGSSKELRERGWRDTAVKIDGPVVSEFQKLFLQTWAKQRGPELNADDYFPTVAPAGKELMRAIGTSPDDAFSTTYLTFIAALTHAQKQAYITNAYFVPDPQLVDALIDAASRGVDVRLILPSTTDSRSAAYAAHSHYAKLLQGGVRIFERRGALLHAKTAVVDGVWSLVGSSNLDWRSAVDNDELNVVILSREFATRMLSDYAGDEAQSKEINLEQWRRRPLRERFREWFFRLIGRLL